MNSSLVHEQKNYIEEQIAFNGDPLLIAALFSESNIAETHLVYENNGEWSIGMGVAAMIRALPGRVELTVDQDCQCWKGNSLTDSIKLALDSLPLEKWRAYGTANFELSRYNFNLELENENEVLLQLFIPKFELRLRKNGVAFLRALEEEKLQQLVKLFETISLKVDKFSIEERINKKRMAVPEIEDDSAESYKKIVSSAVKEISSQRYLKVILSRVIPLEEELDIVASFISGRRENTPARSFLLSMNKLQAAGFSPETVVEVSKDGWVYTQPLAGTRAIGDTPTEELALKNELLNDTKEVQEHAISVKLALDEVMDVCDDNSVSVCDFMSVQRRGSVQHLASKVKGKLKPERNAWHAFNTLFPAVTATGIPKRSSIDAIGRHEKQTRKLYSGCVMIADYDGSLDAALVLRSVFKKAKNAWLQVGAGIVKMSNPQRETEETCEKIRCVSKHLVHV